MTFVKLGVAAVAIAAAAAFAPVPSFADEAKTDQVVVLSDEAMDTVTAGGVSIWDLFKGVDLQEYDGPGVQAGAVVYLSIVKNGGKWDQVNVSYQK